MDLDAAPRAVESIEGTSLNAISVDVEDYFHTEAMTTAVSRGDWDRMPSRVVQNTNRLFELFADRGVHGTFFFLGWVAERYPGLVRQTASLGHEVGCHSFWHRLVYRLSPEEFREDTIRAKKAIEDAAGAPVYGYRAPSFSLVRGTEWAAEILAELGFRYDSSVFPLRHDLYNNPGAPRTPHRIASGAMMEFPVATISIGGQKFPIAGGGYLRMLPYGYIRWGIKRLNKKEGLRAIVYTHPWEIDPEQPRLAATLRSKMRQYTHLSKTFHKLGTLLEDFNFVSLSECFSAELAQEPIPPRSSSNPLTEGTLPSPNRKNFEGPCLQDPAGEK